MNRFVQLAAGMGAVLIAVAPAPAQPSSAPKTLDMRETDATWVSDPHVHEFYQATLDAFANGPDHVDRAAYVARSYQIFRALAAARGMSPERFEKHAAAIPDQMIEIVRRDPQTLASYDDFVVALFGPQSAPKD